MVAEIFLSAGVRDLAASVPASLWFLDAIHVASALAIGDAIDSL
ncbi:hypothetical protein [Streptomyces sp. NPDC060035]